MSTTPITPANPSTYLQQLLDGVSAVAPTSSAAAAAAAGSTAAVSPSATSFATTATASTSALAPQTLGSLLGVQEQGERGQGRRRRRCSSTRR